MPYRIPEPRTEHERRVQAAGYPWISTVMLNPYGKTDEPDEPLPLADKLNLHKHHSKNTHLIISGQLTIQTDDGQLNIMDADNFNRFQKEVKVEPGVSYTGTAGPNGAMFVEGHSILSPTTARRFERRGGLVWYNDRNGLDRDAWLKQHAAECNERGVEVQRVEQRGLFVRH